MAVRWRLSGPTTPAQLPPAWSSSASALTIGAPRARRCRSASARFWASPKPHRRNPPRRRITGHFTAEIAEVAEKLFFLLFSADSARSAVKRFFRSVLIRGEEVDLD